MASPLTRKQMASFGAYKDARRRAADLEARIADRARQVERQLMEEGERLSGELRPCTSEFRRRRLEKQYLHIMHRLSAMRGALALSRATQERLGARGDAGRPAERKATGLRFVHRRQGLDASGNASGRAS